MRSQASHLTSLSFCFFIHQWEYHHLPHSVVQLLSRGYLLYKEYLLLFSSERYFRSTTFSPKYYSKHTPIFTRCQLQWQTIIQLPSSIWIKLAVTLDRQIGMWLFPRLRSTQSGVMSLLTRQNQGQISILNMI